MLSLPAGFIAPCLPINAPQPPSGEQWLHEIKHAGFRIIARKDGKGAILSGDPIVALYVAAILARRLDAANRWLVAVKRQLQTGEPPSAIGKAVAKVEELLSYGGRDPTGW
jgi:hypothetical protein